jgi:hypothetical protein
MAKFGTFLMFIPMAILTAGGFGVLHDQISFTVSSEYFTKFKFIQFGLLDGSIPERLRAGEVGVFASWWMGILLGPLVGTSGFIQRSAVLMRGALLWSLGVTAGCAFLFALCGLIYGYLQTEHIDLAKYQGWYLPVGLVHVRRFLCVGYMHNSAYLGGVLSVPVAWIFQALYRYRHRHAV